MKLNRFFAYFSWFFFLFLSISCDDNPPKSRQPMTLKMDIPNPKILPKSQVIPKSVPEFAKSDMEFKTTEGEKTTKSSPLKDQKSCLKATEQIEMIKNEVQRDGGLWGGLEQAEGLKNYSPVGMQVDSRINKISHALQHLCSSAQGLNYSPLAIFVLKELKTQSEEELKKKLIARGEPKAEVDIILNYAKVAQSSKKRKIHYKAIQKSFDKGKLYIEYYRKFFSRLKSATTAEQIMPDIKAYQEELDKFMSQDKNIKMAIREDFAKPYWMLDGDI